MKRIAIATLVALSLGAGAHAQSVVVQYGNLVYQNASGATEVLTETGADGNPVISPDGSMIAFTRLRSGEQEDSDIAGSGPLRDVYVMRLSDRAVTKIVSAAHSQKPEGELSGINSLVFSPDGSTLYFNTAAWVTSAAIHAVSVQGGRERFVTDGNGVAVVKRGKYTGFLLTSQHRYMDGHGSWNPYVLVSPSGKQIKVLGEFGDPDARAMSAALRNVEAQR
ncbi:TolB family protein [Paraburkholderia sp. A1RO-5L]|uniref:TolB family protein n=1 Tax=Paraburkholderia sp. A1RO-5L TaxID=3028370 RepID=UPI003B7E5369